MSSLHITVVDQQQTLRVDASEIQSVLDDLIREEDVEARIEVAVVDDEQITSVNSEFLGRNRPTDVIAFLYEEGEGRIEGEVIVNADQAMRESEFRSHGPEDELLLYVVHGVLHLLGWDDHTLPERRAMHRRALEVLRGSGRSLDPAL